MSAFLDAAFGFPAVIFTILLVPVILYWLLVMVGAVDLDLDADADLDVDADVDADGTEGSSGWLTGWWQALGLAGMPLTVSVSLIVIFGWFAALLATGLVNLLDLGTVLYLLAGVAALLLAFAFGAVGAALAGRPLSRMFAVTYAEGRSAFVGRTCVIRTEKVTADFGQAEAADPSGATVLLPVRLLPTAGGSGGGNQPAGSGADDLSYGMTALIVEYDRDTEVFLVCSLDGDLLKPS